jgi:hypothetical protein
MSSWRRWRSGLRAARHRHVATLVHEGIEAAAGTAALGLELGAADAALTARGGARVEAQIPVNLATVDAPNKSSHKRNGTRSGAVWKPGWAP